jgi:hypothetical protein
MSRQGARKPPDGDDPAGPAQDPPGAADSAIQQHIGRGLRAIFEEVVAQPVPDKLRKLLDELARKQSKN